MSNGNGASVIRRRNEGPSPEPAEPQPARGTAATATAAKSVRVNRLIGGPVFRLGKAGVRYIGVAGRN
jgi:hypothetical protein